MTTEDTQRPATRPPLFSLDLRALALWRMALGLVTLLDIVLRLRDLQTFYGDDGMLSRPLYFTQSWQFEGYNLFLAAGSTGGLLALFGFWAVAATCLTIGYQTRLAGLLTWYLAASIQLRNPMVLDGGDDFLRVLLFWTPFLPLAARWSVDGRNHPEWRTLPNAFSSVATFGVLFQLFVFYLFAALLKFGEEWLRTGNALYYALSIDQFATSFGHWLAGYPDFLKPVTFAAVGLEYMLAFLLVLGCRVSAARIAFYILAVGFHLSIASMFHFGLFMVIVVAGLTVVFPTAWLDRLFPSTEAQTSWPPDAGVRAPGGYRLSWPLRLFCGFMIFLIGLFNQHSIEHHQRVPPWTWQIALVTFEQQHWHFFAPEPLKSDGWYRLEVTLEDGSVVDGWPNGALDGDGKPVSIAWSFANQRWRRWMQNLTDIDLANNLDWRKSTVDYLAKLWRQDHPDQKARKFTLVLMAEATPPPGQKTTVVRNVLAETGAAAAPRK